MRTDTAIHDQRAQLLGLGQLSLVEHALCPLDARVALQTGAHHETSYRYTDATGERRTARVRIDSPSGLSPNDEFYLWGLLALTFAQEQPAIDFYATPHYCLRQLGVIDASSKGGKSYRLFRESLHRLAGVRYENDCFFDPVRKEHRRVSFGLLGYSLPLDEQSSRTWRIVWHPLFFEFCQATGGRVRFDLALYRRLDPASRRLLLLLQKVFYRRTISPKFGLRELAVETLGFSGGLSNSKLRAKIERCSEILRSEGVINQVVFAARAAGVYIEFQRGVNFAQYAVAPAALLDSPLVEPLEKIGLDEQAVRRVLKHYAHDQVRLWCDVTITAIEQKKRGFFRRSAAAFLIDNLKAARLGQRMPPDWFLAVQKKEDRCRAEAAKPRDPKTPIHPTRALSPELAGKDLVAEMTAQFVAAGQSPAAAKTNAERFAAVKRASAR